MRSGLTYGLCIKETMGVTFIWHLTAMSGFVIDMRVSRPIAEDAAQEESDRSSEAPSFLRRLCKVSPRMLFERRPIRCPKAALEWTTV